MILGTAYFPSIKPAYFPAVPSGGDTTPPTASFSPADITTAQTGYDVTGAFTDAASNVKFSTIGAGNVTITGPNGFSANAGVSTTTPSADAPTITVDYHIANAFTAAMNGTYTVSLNASQISDTASSPNFMGAQTLGTFSVAISPDAPTGLVLSAHTATSLSWTFTKPVGATGYNGLLDGRTTLDITGSLVDNGDGTMTYHRTGLTSGATYSLKVQAYNSAGTSAYTGQVKGTTDMAPNGGASGSMIYVGAGLGLGFD